MANLNDLRDQFAAAALTGLLVTPKKLEGEIDVMGTTIVRMAWDCAEAMLAERERRLGDKIHIQTMWGRGYWIHPIERDQVRAEVAEWLAVMGRAA